MAKRHASGTGGEGSGDPRLSVLFIGDRDLDRFAEYVQERTDALEGAADLLDQDWTETVTAGTGCFVSRCRGSSRGRT